MKLKDYWKINVQNPQFLNEELRRTFIRLIARYTGLEIRERDKAALSEKIILRMKTLKLKSPEDYYQLLNSSNPESYQEWQNFVTTLTNIESYFFRDQEQFLLLRNYIIPELIQRKQTSKTIRICSAGCSSGEEPYSLAILLKELLPDLEQWNVMILGVDINQDVLKKAKQGIYRPWSFRRVDA
ncbi:MAG TPA: CheR family methyltransferase, partial [Coleofasciculaceae cyanobacterium]